MQIWNTVGVSRGTLRLIVMPSVVVRMTILTTSRLGYIWDYLHATRNNACRSSTTRGVCRSCGTTETLCQLLNKRLSNVVSGNVNSIRNTKDNERTLGR